MVGLKECPLCHCVPHIESLMVYPRCTASYRVYFAVCCHCGAKTKTYPSRVMAMLQWNKMAKENSTSGL